MKTFVSRTHWPAILVVAMAGLIVNLAGLQAQTIPPILAGSDRLPSELQGIQPDTRQPANTPPSQAELVTALQQRGVSVDAQSLAANRGQRLLRGSSQEPSEFGRPDNSRNSGSQPQRPSQAAVMQRMRRIPGGQARLDEARQRGARLGTSTGQAPQGGKALYDLASAEPVSSVGPTWGPSVREVPSPVVLGDWSVFFSTTRGYVDGMGLHFTRTYVQYADQFYLSGGACAKMVLRIPASGWYLIWYMVNIQSQAKWVVTARDGTALGEFTGNGTTSIYPLVVELGSGVHVIDACNPHGSRRVRYYMSGAYDIP